MRKELVLFNFTDKNKICGHTKPSTKDFSFGHRAELGTGTEG